MRIMVSGHRIEKFDTPEQALWTEQQFYSILPPIRNNISIAYSGMASGVDLWFCRACYFNDIPFIACIPFEGQEKYMQKEDIENRQLWLNNAKEIKKVRNSWMVEHSDRAIIVWNGIKGGTHNVFEQMLSTDKTIDWICPRRKEVWTL